MQNRKQNEDWSSVKLQYITSQNTRKYGTEPETAENHTRSKHIMKVQTDQRELL